MNLAIGSTRVAYVHSKLVSLLLEDALPAMPDDSGLGGNYPTADRFEEELDDLEALDTLFHRSARYRNTDVRSYPPPWPL